MYVCIYLCNVCVYVCMCVCVYVCMCVLYVCMCVCVYCMCVLYVCTVCVYVCMCVLYVCMCVCVYVYMCVCVYVCMCVCVCVYVCMYVYAFNIAWDVCFFLERIWCRYTGVLHQWLCWRVDPEDAAADQLFRLLSNLYWWTQFGFTRFKHWVLLYKLRRLQVRVLSARSTMNSRCETGVPRMRIRIVSHRSEGPRCPKWLENSLAGKLVFLDAA